MWQPMQTYSDTTRRVIYVNNMKNVCDHQKPRTYFNSRNGHFQSCEMNMIRKETDSWRDHISGKFAQNKFEKQFTFKTQTDSL